MKFFKKIKVPSIEQTEILAYESWSVRWLALGGEVKYLALVTPYYKAEVFTTEKDANEFANSIRNAFALIGMNGDITDVKVERNDK